MRFSETFSLLFRKYPLFRVLFYAALAAVGIVVLTFVTQKQKKIPAIDSINPPVGSPGDTMVIHGTNFGENRGTGFVEIAGNKITASNYISWTDKSIKLILPSNIQDGLLFVQNTAGRSRPQFFANEMGIPVAIPLDTKTLLPRIISISEPNQNYGNLITVNGTNFGSSRGNSMVYFTANRDDITSAENQFLPASEEDFDYEYWSDTEIRVRIPDGSLLGQNQIFVETEKGKSNFFNINVASNVGQKFYTQKKTYLISVDADVDSIDTKNATTITLRVPRPVVTALQPNAELKECNPKPSIENYKNTIVHRIDLQKASNQNKKLRFEQNFLVTSYSLHTEINEKQVKPISDTKRLLFTVSTSPDSLIKSEDAEISALAKQITGKEKNPFVQARLIYNFMIENFELSSRSTDSEDTIHDFMKKKSGDAYDFSILYTTLLRSLKIPTYPICGILVDSDLKTKNHWWTEFYIENFGWIPVDLPLGKGMEFKPFKKIEDVRNFYFGNMDCQHIAFSRGWNELKPSIVNSKIVQRQKSYALQSIWEESSAGNVNYSSLWNDPIIKGIY